MINENTNWQALVREKQFNELLMEWNQKINLISRKKIDAFDLIEDSKLFLEKINFSEGLKIFDLGTGGGLPGIVIAIHHPEVTLTLVDSIQKKIKVVSDIINRLELTNAKAICARVEEIAMLEEHKFQYDYVTARSVTVLQDLAAWSRNLLKKGGKLITLKGGDFKGELNATDKLKYVNRIDVIPKGDKNIIVVEIR